MDKIKIELQGEEMKNAAHIINLFKRDGYKLTYAKEERDYVTAKLVKILYFVKEC